MRRPASLESVDMPTPFHVSVSRRTAEFLIGSDVEFCFAGRHVPHLIISSSGRMLPTLRPNVVGKKIHF